MFETKIGVEKPIEHFNKPFQLVNNAKVYKYAITELTLIEPQKGVLGKKLMVLVGFDSENNILVIVDKNFNRKLQDDSIYRVDMQKGWNNYADFVSSIPVIAIDSIKILYEGILYYKTLQLRLAATPKNSQYFKNTTEIKNAKDFYITIYPLYAYSTSFKVKTTLYEVILVPSAAKEPFIPFNNDLVGTAAVIYKNDSVILFTALQGLLGVSQRTKRIISLEGDNFIVKEASLRKSYITFTNSAGAPQYENINLLSGYSLTKGKKVNLDSFSRLTLIEFSGSWCAPCKMILPELKDLYKEYHHAVDFITITKENDLAEARQYQHNSKIPWEIIYENLNCNNDMCITKRMNVSIYPTFILVDSKGKILLNESGTEGIRLLKQKLKDHVDKKGVLQRN